ncbi:MAG: ATP-binding protein [Anaerolineae bacterium]
MAYTIAVAGKGGTGKTTVAALTIDYLARMGKGSILAIDADPSMNLNLALGVEVEETIGSGREEIVGDIRTGQYNLGLDKQQAFRLMIQKCLVETEHFDLLAMGRPEGPGCYCAPNHLLRQSIDALASNYRFVVIDNEAGLEHISRRTTRDVDLLLVISDPTVRGLIAAQRVFELVAELSSRVHKAHLIVNRVPDCSGNNLGLPQELAVKITELNLPLLGILPQDPAVAERDALGQPLITLPCDTPVRRQLEGLLAQVLSI